MTIDFQKAFKFDLDTNRVLEVPTPEGETDFGEYIGGLIIDVVADARSKKYLFPADETTTMADMAKILADDHSDVAARRFARRLMTAEARVQGRIEHLNKEVQRGMMIQAVVTMGELRYFLIIKAEHFDFIDESSTLKSTGLPIKKKIFKAFCAHLGEDDAPTHAKVSDYRTVISTYWWQDFLELKEEYTDEYNTIKSFEALERKIFNPMKEKHPRDYMYLRNATVQYYRSKEEFVLEDYVQSIIAPYIPEDETLEMDKVADRVRALPEKQEFDGRFRVITNKIKKRIIKHLPLTPQLELVIKENINWDRTVKSVVVDNLKHILIRTDAGYDHFKPS
ncbi:nucleoid-associated protein [Chitinophaga ginsengisoli]|uniref:Nucleoid associated protein NdpA n=1 Tax=Chitinophaga ginsengisoli TaxID=363837 RepID=A0A2P8G273_9BACT|nr:nucleoid-associated protein [Chitinophaga ginsengisoli]PSL28082.1 nucleoid associated protein NdpA [Chitinophaga ginsengisoli]